MGRVPLRLVLGPANAAKAGDVLGAFADAARRRGAVLVVPTAADVGHYTRELAGDGAVLGTVTTFTGLAAEIAARAGYAARPLSGLQRERVIRRVVGRLEPAALGESAAAPGFAAAAGALIAELARSLITPRRWHSALRAWAREDARRADYAEDLGALYGAYTRELDRIGRVDAELFAWRALDRLRERPGAWGGSPVFVYGFDDLLGIERDAVETLARIVGAEVAVSLTYEPGRAALSARAGVVEELRAIAAEVVELPALAHHYAPRSRAALHHLERSLFAPVPERIDPGEAIGLLEAGGERAEAELVAAEVLALLRTGMAPGEIVVVCRSEARSAPLLERGLRRFGIPCGGERRMPVAHTSLGRSLLALGRCALGDERTATAAELLRYLRAPGVLERPERADRLEAELRREGLDGLASARARLGWELREIDALSAAADPLGEIVRHGRRLFAAPHRGCAAILGPEHELDARALAALGAAHAELAELGERVGAEELLRLLETLEVPGGPPPREGAVLISEPLGIRARRFRAVLVCGLCEGEFPRRAAPEPFLSDERRRELALASGLALARREDGLAAERYLFYSCVSRATEIVRLAYRSSDEEGNAVPASPFLVDVAELLDPGWAERRRRRLLADVTWPAESAPTEAERARARARTRGAGPRAVADVPRRRLGERALAHVRHRDVVSGGALESFADCPMKWLVERQLRPEPLGADADPLTRGSFMHTVLEAVLGRLGGSVTPASLADAGRILDEVLAELGDGGLAPGRTPALRRAVLARIEADLNRYFAAEAAGGCDWRPERLELRFGFAGEDGSLPALVLGGEEGEPVLLRGVIDRIDVDPTGSRAAIVRDYKSGSTRIEHQAGRWRSERRFQVGLYMLAVRELLGLDPVAGFYQPLGGRELRARGAYRRGAAPGARLFAADGREAEELDDLLEGVRADAVAVALRLRTGVLAPCPETCSRDGCRYPGICRSS